MTPNKQDGFRTLNFTREVLAPVSALWQAWTAPSARQIWAAPTPSVTVEFLEADTVVGGREVSLCKVDGAPDIRCEVGWLDLQNGQRSLNYELISQASQPLSAALVTAHLSGTEETSRISVTVQLSALASDMAEGYAQGFTAGLANLAGVAERTMVLERLIRAPRAAVWGAWMSPETLPQWWGPNGFSCHTQRIDLRAGGEWVFDMIAPDGTIFPNHHRYGEIRDMQSLAYTLHWGENGPKHADAWALFTDEGGGTRVTLAMVFSTGAEFQQAKGFGAIELGLQTLGKLARFVGAR